MRVLNVVHRVVVVFGDSQVHIKGVFGIGFAAEQEEAHRIGTGPFDQVAQRDVASSTFGNFDFLATADHAHHGVQNVVGVSLRDAHACGLQACANAGNGAVVVGALDVDHLGKAALPLGNVVSHIRHKVGKASVAFFHDAVFVVAVFGRLEPQGTVLLIGFSSGLEFLNCGFNATAGVQAAL